MTTYSVTTGNWNSAAFWSAVSETTTGHTLDFSALGSGYNVEFDSSAGTIAISDGATTFTIGEAGVGGVDVNLGATTDLDCFDTITSASSSDIVQGSSGADNISSGGGQDTMLGDDGNDTLSGGSDGDSILGGGGDDSILSGDGQDTVYGGIGNDTIVSGNTGLNTELSFGEDGDDLISGGTGNDTLEGGDGNDTIDGGAAQDTVTGGQGNDSLSGGSGNDLLLGDLSGVLLNNGATDSVLSASGITNAPTDGLSYELTFASTADTSGVTPLASYAVTGSADEFTLYVDNDVLWVGFDSTEYLNTGLDVSGLFDGDVHTLGVTWDNSSGAFEVYLDGAPSYSGIVAPGVILETGGTFVFGQDQDSVGGSFDASEIFSGTIYGANLYDETRTAGEMNVPGGLPSVDASDPALVSSWIAVPDSVGLKDATGNNPVTTSGTLQARWTSGNDTLAGGTGADTIYAGSGDDDVTGGDGDDEISGASGFDTIGGGDGNDTLDGGWNDDSLSGGKGNDSIDGGHGEDTLDGGTGGDTLDGGDGNDTFDGGDGNDVIYGGDGDDVIEAGEELSFGDDDYIEGGAGNDTITSLETDNGSNDTVYGGSGDDSISMAGGTNRLYGDVGNDNISAGSGSDTIDGGDGNDTLDGGYGSDSLVGGADNDILDGWDGDDTIDGGDGDDTLLGNYGSDAFIGGAGIDTYDIASSSVSSAAFNINLQTGGDQWGNTYSGIENILGGSNSDTIIGDSEDNLILGGNGQDTIAGGNGNDTLIGDLGRDTLYGGAGNDSIEGGDNRDEIYFSEGDDTVDGGSTGNDMDHIDTAWATTGVTVTWGTNQSGTITMGSSTTTFTEIEYVEAFGDGTASGTSDVYDATLATGGILIQDNLGGADTVIGSSFNDDLNFYILGTGGGSFDGTSIDAGDGDDYIYIESGDGTVDGGSGNDNITYVNMEDGDTAVIYGGSGDDTIFGFQYTMVIYGGTGSDRIYASNQDDTIYIEDGFGADTIRGYESDETAGDIIDLSNLSVGATLTYGSNEAGSVTDGIDTLTFTEIENLILSDQADSANATATTTGANIDGGGGSDTITGGIGGDTLAGGDGDDLVDGGAGDDVLKTGLGQDTLLGGDGNDTLMNAAGDDSLVGGAGNDNIVATQGNDTLEGGTGNDTLMGGTDNDSLDGGADDDLLLGDLTGVEFNANGTSGAGIASNISDFPTSALTFEITLASTDTTGDTSLGSYAVSGQDNEFSLQLQAGTLAIYVDGAFTSTGIPAATFLDGNINTLTVSWDSASGALEVYVNGTNSYSGTTATGSTLEQGGTFVLGQDQDTIGGGFDAGQAFEGAIYGVRLYDDVRTGGEIVDTVHAPVADTSDPNLIANWVPDPNASSFTDQTGNHAMSMTGNRSATWSSGNDTILGGAGLDTLLGGGGNDSLDGGDDNDSLDGDVGNDTLLGGAGADTVLMGEGDDVAYGGEGADEFYTEVGNDTVFGEGGNDSIYGWYINSDLYIDGGAGDDSIFGSGEDTILGGIGNDWIDSGDGNDSIDGGAGNDTIYHYGDGVATIRGGTGDDYIDTDDDEDLIIVEDGFGNDTVLAGSGVDAGLDQDTLNFSEMTATGITVIYSDAEDGTATSGGDTLIFTDVEEFVLTDQNDSVNAAADTLGVNIVAGDGADTITGGSGADTISGGDGNDYIEGGDGDDFLTTGLGQDTLIGGDGADTLMNSDGDDSLDGGAGDDSIVATGGEDTLRGGAGADTMEGGNDADTFIIEDGFGDDDITGGEGTTDGTDVDFDVIDLSAVTGPVTVNYISNEEGTITDGTDTITFFEIEGLILTDQNDSVDSTGDVLGVDIVAGAGDDTITAGTGADTLDGGDGADILNAGEGDDSLTGGADNDTLLGQAGDDYLEGGSGNDMLFGLSDEDTLFGDDGDDYLVGGAGDDSLDGGTGNDTILGGTGHDSISDGTGDDYVEAGDGDDIIGGWLGNDTFDGGDGNDSIEGGDGSDSILGGSGNDLLVGYDAAGLTSGSTVVATDDGAADTIDGGTGNDTIAGGGGNDSLTGGDGNDTFTYSVGDGQDTITDFNTGNSGTLDDGDTTNNDFIDLSAFYEDIWELHADQADDGVLNQSNNGVGAVDYSDNTQFGAGDGIAFTGAGADGSFFTVENTGVVCFAAGTMILTEQGEVPVERLKVGDNIVTRDNGPQPLLWSATRRLGARELAAAPHLRPVEIASDAFSNDRPLVVSPQHGVLLGLDGEEYLARAIHLARLKGGTVRKLNGCRHVSYWHLFFEAHQIVFSNGIPSESFFPGPHAVASLAPDSRRELHAFLPGIATAKDSPTIHRLYGSPTRTYTRTSTLPDNVRAFASTN